MKSAPDFIHELREYHCIPVQATHLSGQQVTPLTTEEKKAISSPSSQEAINVLVEFYSGTPI